jgi:hypothetical protein
MARGMTTCPLEDIFVVAITMADSVAPLASRSW